MKKNNQPKQVFLKPEPATVQPQRLVVRCSEQDFYFNYRDIVCIEAEGSQAIIHAHHKSIHEPKIVVCRNLKQLQDVLPADRFLRTHKSWLVNMQYVHGRIKGEVHLLKISKDFAVPIAERKLTAVLTALEQFDITAFTNL